MICVCVSVCVCASAMCVCVDVAWRIEQKCNCVVLLG